MGDKRRVYVSIHHRDELSLQENRVRLGYNAFHWGILITPKKSDGPDSLAFDVHDGAMPDPVQRIDTNPDRNWMFRAMIRVDPIRSGRLIGRILIGKVPKTITDKQIESILATVPLPVKDTTPQETCVTWILAAVTVLQNAGIARSFDLSDFSSWALSRAERWMASPDAKNIDDYKVGSK